ncbi:MAG: hypothetical protein LBR72_04440 [Oscillospiraceae bacterium]|jgi:hypothetical protein|nr:hypothetical protein [Oscillospiraceae bacterium]
MISFMYKAAMPGNPTFYANGLQDYSVKGLESLKALGMNTVFVNLAWSRPHIDAVVLEAVAVSKTFPLTSDIREVENARARISERIRNVKSMGMNAMALFGIPQYMDYSKLPDEYKVLMGASVSLISPEQVTCVLSPETRVYYRELLEDMLSHMPDLDGMLVYSYDELAEVCDENSDCPRCKGIPAENRIAEFLDWLLATVNEIKPGFQIWWEPWELSWAQTYGILEKCSKEIAVSCHSTIHEVYFVNHPDLWLRSVAGLCRKQGREMIVELFLSGCGEDLYHCPSFPCPRLVYEQLESVSVLQGISGIKEYYGICQKFSGLNEEALRYSLNSPSPDYPSFIKGAADEYAIGGASAQALLSSWELASHTLETLPWELSWVMRTGNYHPYDMSYYGKTGFYELMRTPWDSPSWLSNRRSYYMVTRDDSIVNDTYSLDVLKRLEICFGYMDTVCAALSGATVKDSYKEQIERQIYSVKALQLVMKCRYYHLLDTLTEKHGGRFGKYEREAARADDRKNARDMLALAENPPNGVPVTFDLGILRNFVSREG